MRKRGQRGGFWGNDEHNREEEKREERREESGGVEGRPKKLRLHFRKKEGIGLESGWKEG